MKTLFVLALFFLFAPSATAQKADHIGVYTSVLTGPDKYIAYLFLSIDSFVLIQPYSKAHNYRVPIHRGTWTLTGNKGKLMIADRLFKTILFNPEPAISPTGEKTKLHDVVIDGDNYFLQSQN